MATLTVNRTNKALRIVDTIRKLDAWLTAGDQLADLIDAIAQMPPRWWADIAAQAETLPPSVETVQMVVSMLREELRNPDPFDGFQ